MSGDGEKSYAAEARLDYQVNGGWSIPFEGTKQTQEGRTSTTLTDDADLQCLLEAGGIYAVTLDIFYTGGAGASEGDLKWDIWAPSGATHQWNGQMRLASDGGAIHQMGMGDTTGTIVAWTNGLSNNYAFSFTGSLYMSSTPGNMKFRWATNVNNGTQTRILVNSRISAARRY